MVRTRLPLVTLIVSAFVLVSTWPANSATIAGTKCTKVNSTKSVANIKYTCVKSGNKLAWNKGVQIKASPSPTLQASSEDKYSATSESSSTASPNVSPSGNFPSSAPDVVIQNVTPGAFCSPAGSKGTSSKGVSYECKSSATDTRNRWRQ